MAGTNFTMVPYRGGTTQITGILAGDIPLGMESINVSLPLWRELEAAGLTMYGQMTAGSWIYIGTQGILQGTYETLAELGIGDDIFPISARTGEGVEALSDHLVSLVPEGPFQRRCWVCHAREKHSVRKTYDFSWRNTNGPTQS